MSEGHSKGGGIINVIGVVRDRMGAEAFAALVATLPAATQALINRRILAVEWIAIADMLPLTEKFFTDWCGGDEAKLIDQSRESCRRDFNTLYRFFLRVLSPAYVLQRTAQIFHTYTDMGDLAIVSRRQESGKEILHLRMENYYPSPLYAITTQAYIIEILTLAQAKDLVVERRNVVVENDRLSCDYDVAFLS
jgi:hypothetical protein